MDARVVERILTARRFKRIAHHIWWRAGAEPHFAVVHGTSPLCEVTVVHVFGPGDEQPAFGTGTLATEWALERTLTDLGL